MFKNAFSISAMKAIHFDKKRNNTPNNEVVREGPENKHLFNESPDTKELGLKARRTLEVC